MGIAEQDGSYPRPGLRRGRWTSLDGPWGFAHDDHDAGLAEHWFATGHEGPFDRIIEVPFPPESPASGICARGPHPVVWYRRTVAHDDLAAHDSEQGSHRVLVHFGAVDYRAQVWLDGQLVATHEGGQTPFTADVTHALTPAAAEHVLVVWAEDSVRDAVK